MAKHQPGSTVMFKRVFIVVLTSYFVASCQSQEVEPAIPETPRDTTITVSNAFNRLKLDSQTVMRFIDSAGITDTAYMLIRNFYNSRNYQYAWFDEKGLTEHASMLWNLYQDYDAYAVNAPASDTLLKNHLQDWLTDTTTVIKPEVARTIELKLTKLFFDYAFAKYLGNLNPAELQWHIPRRKVDVSALLDTLVSGSKYDGHDWEPLHPQYRLLREKLVFYSKMAGKGKWDSISLGARKKLEAGDKDSIIVNVKTKLQLLGLFPSDDSSAVFTKELKDSLIQFQQQFGVTANGVIGPATIAQLNVPFRQRIQQIMINMERMRWLPRQPQGAWILANIPSFRLQVFEGDSIALRMNIIVGTSATKTVIFSDELKYVVFSPYWNVPASIVRNEILPEMRKNPNYLARSRMEKTGMSNGLPVIRQLPGANNALGEVKFLFPNNYNIYLHDTPIKSYFKETNRAFSHGCIRISDPFALAQFLLRNDTTWTDKKIRAAMSAGKEKWVTLTGHVPVFITYFTAWVDREGRLQFRNDVYGHDKRMAERLFMKSTTLAAK